MPRRSSIVPALALSLASAASVAAQAPRAPRAPRAPAASGGARGSVQGDVYLVTKAGDVKRAAGNTVYLIPESAGTAILSPEECTARSQLADVASAGARLATSSARVERLAPGEAPAGVADTAARRTAVDSTSADSAAARAGAYLRAGVQASAPTGVNAHYQFTGVRPGRYYLLAETEIDSSHYQWLTAVALRPGQRLTRDLDTSVASEGRVYCVKP